MKYKYLFFIALIYNINAIAQLGFNFDSATPNTADMMRYGNTPIKKVNGEISVSIPLYNIDTRNFKMPISLGYSNPGLIPSKQSGPVGYSWFLNAGGVIHRKVEGIPDESFDNDTGDINDKVKGKWHGFIYGEENTTAFERVSNDDIEDFNSHKVDARSNMLSMTTSAPDLSNSKGVYETSPDKFSFNFGGYSGSFFMTYNKEIKVITDTPNKFRVDLSELSYYNNSRNTLNSVKFTSVQNSKIKIHTDNGYTYEFGGDLTSLQFSFSVANLSPGKSDNRDHISLNPAINSWYLTKIIAPDGEVMNISYKSGISNKITNDLSDFTDTPNNPPPVVMSTSKSQYVDPWLINSLYNQGNPAGYLGGSGRNSTSNVSLNYSMSNACYVEKIEIPHKLRLDFNYSLKSRKFYNNLPTGTSFIANKVNVKGYQLDHINITSTNTSERLINSFDFEYTYGNNSSNRRLFLKAIKELGNTPNNLSGVKSHEFKYNSYLFPDPLTLGVDHWGFYNGKNTNSNNPNSSEPGDTPFIPNPEYKPNSFQVIGFVEDSRDPSELSINCMLSRITYPTGGYSNFEYENHTCGKRIEFNPKFSLNDDFEVPQKVGGARIKRIVDFDGNQQTQERTFYYNSSGVLSQWPRYNIPTSKNDPIYYPIYSSTYNTKVAFGSHMAYERVREKYANGSYTDSYFTTQSNGRYDESVTVNNFDLKNPPIITIGDLITADGNITNPNVAPLRYGGYDDILFES